MNLSPSPRAALWAARATLAASAALVGLALSSAADGHRSGALVPTQVGWWGAVAAMVVAVIVPGALGLTIVRMAAPLGAAAAIGGLAAGAATGLGIGALVAALVATVVVMSAEFGEAMVQGAAYGDERRFPLRTPVSYYLPLVASWVWWCGLLAAAVVPLGLRLWVPGAVGALAAGGFAWFLGRRVHRFSRRWLVIVPAGVVVHDHVVLAETLMVPKGNLRTCGLAYADTQALDLSGPAGGHLLEITVVEMEKPILAPTRTEPKGKAFHAAAFLIAPSRPGRALAALTAAGAPTA